jgi:O-antigen ligase
VTASAERWAALPIPRSGRRIGPIVIVAMAVAGGIAVCVFGPNTALVPIALMGALWASIRAPGVLLAAYLLIPYYKASLGPLTPIDLTVMLAAVNGLQIVILMATGIRFRGSGVGIALWVILGMVVLAGVMWAGDEQLALDRAIVWWALILLPSAAAVRVGSEARFVDQFLATVFATGTIIVLLGLPDSFGVARLTVVGENTIQSGQIALIVALVAIVWFLRVAPPALRVLAALIVPLGLIESVASGSRGPILAFGVVLGVAILRRVLSRRSLSKQDVRLLLLGATGAAALLVTIDRLPGQSVARFLLLVRTLAPGGPADSSAGARVDLFAAAAGMFSEQPLLGYGTGGFAAYAQTHPGLTGYLYPHNDLLQLGSELGVIGVGLFAGLVVIALARRIPDEPRWRTIRALFLFMLVNSLVSGDIYSDRLLWGLLVVLVASPFMNRKRRLNLGAPKGVPVAAEPAPSS